MFSTIDALPDHVTGLLGEGEITGADYQRVVVPAIETATKSGKPFSLLFVLADGASYDAAALWEDAKVGLDHMSGLDRIAVVSDDGRFQAAAKLVGVFMPGRVRVFAHGSRAQAIDWLTHAT